MARFLPGESFGIPTGLLNRLGRFPSVLTGEPEEDLSRFRTPPIVPNPPSATRTSPTLTGGTKSAEDFSALQATAAPKRSKLENLLYFLVPAARGFIASQFGRRRDRTRNFLAGALGGGVDVLQDIATRPARQRAARQAAIEAALKERRAAEKHAEDIKQTRAQTAETVKRTEGLGKSKAELEFREVKNADGSTTIYERQKGSNEPWRPSLAERTEPEVSPALVASPEALERSRTRRVPFGSAAPPPKAENLSDFEQAFQREFGRLPTLKDNRDYELSVEEGRARIRKKFDKPSAGEERKERESLVREFSDRALARARRKNPAFDQLEAEEQINAIQDEARQMAGADPENLRPILRDALGEINAIVRRRRPPAKSRNLAPEEVKKNLKIR